MWRLLFAVLAFFMVIAVVKMVIIALVVAGLIFRTKVTVFLLFIGGMTSLIAAYPIAGLGLLGAIIVLAVINRAKWGLTDAGPTALDRGLDDPEQE